MPTDSPAWAATRDASWYARPDIHGRKVVHMAGRPAPRNEGTMSRCGRSVLDSDLRWDPEHVPQNLRCRSNGCRQTWPDFHPEQHQAPHHVKGETT